MTYMLATHEEKIAREWEKYKGYTVRPLPSTVRYYQRWLTDSMCKNQFLLYGGTPEIRTIFQQQEQSVTLIDRNRKMIRALGLLTQKQMPLAQNEQYVERNWLDPSLEPNSFDLIIGDDAINMVRWDEFYTFLSLAHQRLCRGGVFICHLLVKPDDQFIDQDFYSLLSDYQKGRISSHYDLASRLNYLCFNKTDYSMGWQKTICQLGRDKLNSFKPQFDFVDIFRYCNSQFYCPPQLYFENLLPSLFKIEEIFYAHEHEYCLFEPVYVLRKN